MATATSSVTWHGMNLWRLEWLRLKRTPRALTMAAVFVFFGLLQPILTKYQRQILGHVGNGVRISFPPATPAAGVSGYFGELAGTGLIVVVVIAAGAFTFDAHHGLAIFLRTRVTGFWRLVAPRYTVNAAAAGLAFALGAVLSGTHHLVHYLPAFAVTVAASGAALAVAVLRLRAREI
jgi:ABC-type transport system involved in multi-copper enzyme maturation permease subunit